MSGNKSSTSTVTIPPEVLARYNATWDRASAAASAPYQRYSNNVTDFVAPLTASQTAGIAGANQYATAAQPYYGEATDILHNTRGEVTPYYGTATDYAAKSGQDVNAGGLDVNRYLNPYINYTLGATSALLNQNNQQAMAGQLGNAISQGAFGGDRAGIAAANLNQQQRLSNAKTYSDILSGGYDTAMGVAQQQQGQTLSADQANRAAALAASQQYQGLGKDIYGMETGMARQIAETGQGAQDAGLAGAQAQLAAGQVQQTTEQAGKDALRNQFMQEQGYPFQVADFMANQAAALGPLYGTTTTSRSKSDVRLKENIKEVGKTFDGQPIYSYNFKGHPQTQIGLMAQEVEQHRPHAVANDRDGYKSVDYAEATEHAAKRGHFAAGGVIPSSQGGPVDYSNAGEGFAAGGSPGGFDPAMMQRILDQAKAMYGPAAGGVSGNPTAGHMYGYTPHAIQPSQQLKAAEGPSEGPSTEDVINKYGDMGVNAAQGADKVRDIYKKWKKPEGGVAPPTADTPMPDLSETGTGAPSPVTVNPLPSADPAAPPATPGFVNKSMHAAGDAAKNGFNSLKHLFGYADGGFADIAENQKDMYANSGFNHQAGPVGSGGIQKHPGLGAAHAAPMGQSPMEEAQSTSKGIGNAALTAQGIGKATGIGAPTGLSAANIGALNAGGAGLSAAGAPLTGAGLAGATEAITGGTTALGAAGTGAGLAAGAGEAAGLGATALGTTAATLAPAAASTALTAAPVVAAAAPSIGATIAAAIPAFLAMFSDERLKEDIKLVGKTYDGQHVYSYRMKGDPTTHMGLLAQEVEHHHPEAVGLAGGYKTVNYKQATHEAAERGHFAGGGVAGREGYDDGGFAGSILGRYLGFDPEIQAKRKADYEAQTNAYSHRNDVNNAGLLNTLSDWIGTKKVPVPAETPTPALTAPSLSQIASSVRPATQPSQGLKIDTGVPAPTSTPPAQGLAAGRSAMRHARAPTTGGVLPVPAPPATPAPTGTNEATPMADAAVNPFLGKPMMLNQYDKLPTAPSYLDTAKSVLSSKVGDIGGKIGGMAKEALTNPDILIPILSGIGAFGSTGTTDLGSKLAAGIGAGAKSYQGMRQFEIDKAKTEAQTSGELATAGATRLQSRFDFIDMAKKGLIPHRPGDAPNVFRDGEGNPIDIGSSETLISNAALPYSGTPTGAPPSGAPTQPFYPGQLGSEGAKSSPHAFAVYSGLPPELKAQETAAYSNIKTGSQDAASGRRDANTYGTAFLAGSGGLLAPGASTPWLRSIVAPYNDVMRKIPGGAAYLIDPQGVGSADIIGKMQGGMGFAKQNAQGDRTVQGLETALGMTPGTATDRTAGASILADTYLANQKNDDLNHYADQYDTHKGTSLEGQLKVSDMTAAFTQDTAQTYQREREALKQFLLSRDQQGKSQYEKAVHIFNNAAPDSAAYKTAVKALDDAYGPGFHRYFIGR